MYFRLVQKVGVIWLLIAVFGYVSFGGFIQWHAELTKVRQDIKHQLKASVAPEKLHRFQLSKKEFQRLEWTRENKEFRFRDHLYDVVMKKEKGAELTLLCIRDTEEEKLFKDLNRLISNHFEKDKQDPKSKGKIKYLKKDWVGDPSANVFNAIQKSDYPYPNAPALFSIFPEVMAPPPWSVIS